MYALNVLIESAKLIAADHGRLKLTQIGINPYDGLVGTLPNPMIKKLLNATIGDIANSQPSDWQEEE